MILEAVEILRTMYCDREAEKKDTARFGTLGTQCKEDRLDRKRRNTDYLLHIATTHQNLGSFR